MPLKKRYRSLLFLVLICFHQLSAQENTNRWRLGSDGSIVWQVEQRVPHADHIEMSGEMLSSIVRYTVNADSSLSLHRTIVWPMLRSHPNKTRNHLLRTFEWDIVKAININEKPVIAEKVKKITLNGLLNVISVAKPGIEISRTIFPSATAPAFIESVQIKNVSGKAVAIEIPDHTSVYETDSAKGIYGAYQYRERSIGGGNYNLENDQSLTCYLIIEAYKKGESPKARDPELERQQRSDKITQWWSALMLETPDEVLNRAFAFAKLRGSESIYRTKGGLMHGPGGGAYYAAIWANDQAEYIGPFFPFLGYDIGNEASLNAYRHFARFMNAEYKPIPSSIISEGENTWHGAKDRGDGAMIAYGAARFALALGDKKTAEELWSLIEWTLEYCKRKINDKGVVASNSDELENRFPSGDANLCTSSLYYDALLSAVYLGKALNKPAAQLADYSKRAGEIKTAIEKHFGSTVEGFQTYRYYEGNDVLRAWICMPLTVGIYERKKGTVDALFSPRLWTPDGLATQAGKETFWDRSTLYALRGVFAAGDKTKAFDYLKYYSNRRLLGDHVPYPVEAYPEGNQRHLSAESGLYCRIFTEGMFGIRPTGLRSFTLTPYLPNEWPTMALRKIHAFGNTFDIEVKKEKDKLRIVVSSGDKKIVNKLIREGDTISVSL
jgi:hypothetical protein